MKFEEIYEKLGMFRSLAFSMKSGEYNLTKNLENSVIDSFILPKVETLTITFGAQSCSLLNGIFFFRMNSKKFTSNYENTQQSVFRFDNRRILTTSKRNNLHVVELKS